MLQRKRFIVIGTVDSYRPGDLIDLEVGDDGLPLSRLMRARVRPHSGQVALSDSLRAEQALSAAREEAGRIIADAKAQAAGIVAEAEAQAAAILEGAKSGKK